MPVPFGVLIPGPSPPNELIIVTAAFAVPPVALPFTPPAGPKKP